MSSRFDKCRASNAFQHGTILLAFHPSWLVRLLLAASCWAPVDYFKLMTCLATWVVASIPCLASRDHSVWDWTQPIPVLKQLVLLITFLPACWCSRVANRSLLVAIESSWHSLVYDVKVVYTYLFCHLFFLDTIFYGSPKSWECFHESYHRAQKKSLQM